MTAEPVCEALVRKIDGREARVAVIGVGYVGLPLVLAFADAGFRVVGHDISADRIRRLEAGLSPFSHVDAAELAGARKTGRVAWSTDPACLAEADIVVICVPTPLDRNREPDLSAIRDAAEAIAARIHRGQLVVLESTSFPGTTREVVKPILERSGLRPGEDFMLGFSPEREDPGNSRLRAIPKIVSGLDGPSLEAVTKTYEAVVRSVVPVSSLEVAEAAKLLENIFRSINIALVNELKLIFLRMGIDIWEVIRASSTKPFGFMPFHPGPGLGGHCIPVDPFYLSWRARAFGMNARLIELAGEINQVMPQHVVMNTAVALNDHAKPVRGSRVLIAGIAYKKNVGDTRQSPALLIWEQLAALGAEVDYIDPHVPEIDDHTAPAAVIGRRALPHETADFDAFDAVVIAADHDALPYERMGREARLIVDTRNAMAGHAVAGTLVMS